MSQRPTHQSESYTTPYFKIYIDGKPLSDFEMSLVEEIVYEDNSTGSDMVSITIHDPDYTIISNPKIVKSTPCKVEGGYIHKYKTFIDGYISAIDVDFPQEGTPVLVIHVMDKTYLMNRVERKKVYKNMTYKEIAGKIAMQYGFKFIGDVTGQGAKRHETVTQSYETDIQFLIRLASEIGYITYINAEQNVFYFKDKEWYFKNLPSTTVWYRKPPFDVISFRPRIIQADQLDELEESDVDNKDKKITSAKVTNENKAKDTGGGGSSGGSSNGGSSGGSSGGGKSGEMKYDPYTGKWSKV